MLKKRTLVLSIFFVTLIYFNQEAFAFHKKNSLPRGQAVDWKLEEETVKDAKYRIKSEYCGYKAKEVTSSELIEEKIRDPATGLIILDPETGSEKTRTKLNETKKIKIYGYHATEPRRVKSPLRPNLNKLYFEFDGGTRFLEVLKMYCLQDLEKGRPSKFKDSYLETLYTKIAKDNGLINVKKDVGDYNLSIGERIFKDGIFVEDKNIVYYLPDFLIEAEKQNIKDEAAAAAAAIKAAADKKWINKHKPELIKKVKAKIKEYDKKIKEINNDFSQLEAALKQYVNTFNFANDGAEETFNLTGNKANKDIKEKLKLLTQKKKLLLNETKIKKFESELDGIYKRIGTLEGLDNYKDITKLIKDIDSVTKSKNKIKGYEDDFKSLKSEKLGSDALEYSIVLVLATPILVPEAEPLVDVSVS